MAGQAPLDELVVAKSDQLLTSDEMVALQHLTDAARTIRRIIGEGPQAIHDWAEAASRIHDLQHLVMAQAAARAYPGAFRLLGEAS